uniref:Uncharacterized protein n=1 Tax=Macrostomum lignano TaxID=282301 RepID=A0A1I8FBD0_9PLAT
MRLLAVTDETGADMGGKANTWRQLDTSQAAPRHTVFRDVFVRLFGHSSNDAATSTSSAAADRPMRPVRRFAGEQLRVLAEVEAPRLTAGGPAAADGSSQAEKWQRQAR